ncbi:hypothetical protein CANINC_000172 [Pichia inconspicua]|uniref:Mediator of RNA polymerase II transcription subunit 5 n=1 Tax=Pichia inconspicua TaxID=52247 RepID=A0A4T0X716_9ASCO|nr:hypothetical protein CANINC_000172 [[Candida] inconspicua]
MEIDALPCIEVDTTFNSFDEFLSDSLRKNYSPEEFFTLFQEFKSGKRENTTEQNYASLFRDLDKSATQRSYVLQLFVKSDIENSCHELINFFKIISSQIPLKDNILVLMLMNQAQNTFSWKAYSQNTEFLQVLAEYATKLTTEYDHSTQQKRLIFLFVKFLTNFFMNPPENGLNDVFVHAASHFADSLSANALITEHRLLQKHLTEYNVIAIKHGFVTQKYSGLPLQTQNLPSRGERGGNSRSFKIQKIIWLSHRVLIENVGLDAQFTSDFKSLIKLSNLSTLESLPMFVIELLTTAFDCLQLSSPENSHIWKDYIVSKIPLFFKNELKLNQLKVEKAFSTFLSDHPKIIEIYRPILRDMEKSFIYLELLKPTSLKMTPFFEPNLKFSLDELNHEFTHKFLECNPEFTSIEEIGIETYLEKINTSIILKQKFCQLAIESLNSFVLTGDSLRLRRLLISLCINFEILDNVLLFDSPKKIVSLLLKFLSNNVTNAPESTNMNVAQKILNQSDQPEITMDYDIGSDDSSNVQEHLSDIATVFIITQFFLERYKIIVKYDEFDEYSIALSLLSGFKLITTKKDGFKEISEVTITDKTYNTWISSMFDASNSEGISDSLVQMSTPFEYSILIPRIVSEAVLCNSIGWLDNEALSGGLEYLHEKFLVGWLSFVVQEIVNLFGSYEKENVLPVAEKALKQILTVSDTESIDIKVLVKICKNINNNLLWNNFPSLREDLVQPAKSITFDDAITDLLKFVSLNDRKELDEKLLTFDIKLIWNQLLSEKLPVEFIFEKLVDLSINHGTNSEICRDAIAFILVTFAKWKLPDDISTTWAEALHLLNDSKDNFVDLLFNRKPQVLNIIGSIETDIVNNKQQDEDPESSFFGFIQDPEMEERITPVEVNSGSKPGLDLYGYNLVVLAYQNKGNETFDTFVRSLMDYLN